MPLDNKLYHQNSEIFQRYIALTTQKPILVSKVLDGLEKRLSRASAKVFTFIDIGCGDGVVTLPILEGLSEKTQVKAVCIEPSTELINVVRSKTRKKIAFIQEDIEKVNNLLEADFVLMSHLFSYIHDSKKTLKKVYDSMNVGGIGLIVVNNSESDDSKLRKKITAKYDLFSEKLQSDLNDLGIIYQIEVVESQIDISGIPTMNSEGKAIISFFKHKIFEEIPVAEVKKIRSDILSLAAGKDILTKREDYIWFSK